jgi:hypothetical protein
VPSPSHLADNLKARYPGVKPFTAEEKDLFFGREKDIEDLYRLIFIKQTVVLYGKSGYGKSSLLNAGIIPQLQAEGAWTCLSIRFNNFSEREEAEQVSPADNIKLRLKQGLDKDATSVIDSVLPGEDSFWYWVKARQFADKRSQFIFFFDQFEELFTYPRIQVEEFSEQLSQLLYNTLPVRFRKRLTEMDERNEVSDELHHFLYERPDIKVVFSVRSDRVSQLNMLTDRHPGILQNCYELDTLNRKEAEQAIVKPARAPQENGFATPPFSFTEGALKKILNSVANPQDGKIETATLQIICRYVETDLVADKKISLVNDESLGDIADIFMQYYESILSKLNSGERDKAQHLIEDELIEEGRRNTLTASYIKNKFGIGESLLLQLEQSSLLRKERDAAGRILYEISHDTLIGAIERVAEKRRVVEEEARRQKLEEQITEERSRAKHLEELNKKAVFRWRLSLGFAFISLVIAAFAFIFFQRAKKQESNAKGQTNLANVELFKNKMQQAKTLFEDVKNSYMLSNDYKLAMRNLNAADSLLTVNVIELPQQEQNERELLLKEIADSLVVCQRKMNERK